MKNKCHKISFNAYSKEDAKYILSYTLDNQPPHPDDNIVRQQLRKILLERMRWLAPRYQNALRMYFGINEDERIYTYKEIGDYYRVSPEGSRQFVQKSLRSLRHPKHSQHFRIFL